MVGNRLAALGTTNAQTEYIYVNTNGSMISNNILTGPGTTGIKCYGTDSIISDNILNGPGGSYAFSSWAIYAPNNAISIMNNTISEMNSFGFIITNGTGPIGISNVASGKYAAKIIGNSVSGTGIWKMVDLYGSAHVVNDNRFYNINSYTSGDNPQICIYLNSGLSSSLFIGNMLDGYYSNVITSNGNTVSALTISGNSVIGTIGNNSINLNGATRGCLIIGNRFPDSTTFPTNGASMTNVVLIGSPANLIPTGTNFGL